MFLSIGGQAILGGWAQLLGQIKVLDHVVSSDAGLVAAFEAVDGVITRLVDATSSTETSLRRVGQALRQVGDHRKVGEVVQGRTPSSDGPARRQCSHGHLQTSPADECSWREVATPPAGAQAAGQVLGQACGPITPAAVDLLAGCRDRGVSIYLPVPILPQLSAFGLLLMSRCLWVKDTGFRASTNLPWNALP